MNISRHEIKKIQMAGEQQMVISKYTVYIAVLLLINIVGIISPAHIAWLIILSVVYMFMLDKWIKTKSLAIPKLVIATLVFQNTFMGIAMHLFKVDGKDITIYSQIPALFIVLAATGIIFHTRNIKKHLLFMLYIIIILFNYVISPNKSVINLAYNTRNFIVFYLVYVIGAYIIRDRKKFDEISRYIVNICILSGLVGILGSITDGQLYIFLGAQEVGSVKNLNRGINLIDGRLPGYFYGDFLGAYYWRMGSLFLEPVNFSLFIALAVIMKASSLKTLKDYMQCIFLLIIQFFTFGKGGLLISGISILAMIACHIMTKNLKVSGRTSFVLSKWGIFLGVVIISFFYGSRYAYDMHFYAIRITIEALAKKPWGFGIGTVGNVNRDVFDINSFLGAETGVLNFWCQLGIEGLLIFMALLYGMSNRCLKTYEVEKTTQNFIIALLPMILFLVFMFQENVFTTQVITGYMFLVGAKSNETRMMTSSDEIVRI